ncbi:serine phosphatase RsbU (regulator of sigma subunit)/anti-sigma regulatory factor (Ser/Thr protein kinase) [Streptomyces sp. B3I7]|uniref:SpoIIE family protein phosphatase n=1 Tax=Streptomyces sp. B3I7 TaxID=3042269 RepID=UPI00278063A8|nr:SpoIIE family protein phosphatase [Streptomyces sp. B3I7]MDQ0809565.1 serine phosphatase RsbU (regulator of sigma subunit)/anti-sigma regulatory factor (Ser/Thr protein kinase) [Streptomyces sp. B3I7]
MADRGVSAPSLPDDWPDRPDPILALNRMGSFDWDLDTGVTQMDAQALELFDLRAGEFDDRVDSLTPRLHAPDIPRLEELVTRALEEGGENYGAYFRIRRRDGSLRWTHTQGYIRRDATGRARRIIGIVRDATQELRDSRARSEQAARDIARRRQADVAQATMAALAHARTVQDVIDVLRETEGRMWMGAASLVMGLVEGGRIRLVAEGPTGDFLPGTQITGIDEPYPMSDAVRTLVPQFIESPEEFGERYPILWPHLAHLRITSAAYLPLVAQGSPIGGIGLLYGDRHGFTAEERDILVALTSTIAQSLQRAMLYEQESDLAQELQQAMLPRSLPRVPDADVAVRYRAAVRGSSPGRNIGGDWYDLIPLPGGRVGAVVGDVQGHDTQAAAVMGQLRIVLRAYAAEGHPPATVVARASVFLHELDTHRFATCLYAEADLSTGVVQFVRAGHVDPLVRGADGSCRRVLVEGGLPLGLSALFDSLEYPVQTMELDPGQMLVLCTDGLVELPGLDLDDGMRELAEQVAAGPEDVGDLADLLIAGAADRGGDDDVALLLLRRREQPGSAGGRLQQYVAPGDPGALREARHVVRAAVRAWGARDRADEIELVTDELVTNALMHTDGAAVVTLRSLPGPERRLRTEVEDASSALPRRREAGASGVSGRGLLLVDQLADAWGVEARGGGKVVWCEFVVPEDGAA